MGIRSWVISEDVATNAGIAVVQVALAAGNRGHDLTTVDVIRAPARDTRLAFVLTSDETPITAAAPGTLTIAGRDRALQLPLVDIDGKPGFMDFRPCGGLRIPKNANIVNLGNASGAGAEQHTYSLFVDDPGFPGFPMGKSSKSCLKVRMTTAAGIAATITAPTDICGRGVAYANAIAAIPDSANIGVTLKKIGGMAAAGYSGICIRNVAQDANLVLPLVATYPITYDLGMLLAGTPGAGLFCKADEPLMVGPLGVGAGTQVLEMELGIEGPDITDLA